jgi:hypothetical protein
VKRLGDEAGRGTSTSTVTLVGSTGMIVDIGEVPPTARSTASKATRLDCSSRTVAAEAGEGVLNICGDGTTRTAGVATDGLILTKPAKPLTSFFRALTSFINP